MRIAILNNTPFDAPGGSGRIAGVYAELLRARGHETKWWGARSAFQTLGAMDPVTRLWFHLNDLSSDADTAREIRDWQPDVLLTHNLTGCGFGTPKALRAKGFRWVHVLHDVQLIEPSGRIVEGESVRLFRRPWRGLWSDLRQTAMGEPDAVVSPTQWLLDLHRSYGFFPSCRTEMIPNPVRATHASPGSIGRHAGQGDTCVAPTVIYVGRLDPDKGIDLLLAAWKTIDLPSKRLIVVGDGSWRTKISDPTVEMRGALPHEDVRSSFAECTVAVVPSRVWENQPTVILEALAAGCRVVAADVGGIRETLGDAGILVPPCSVDALADGIRRALDRGPDPSVVAQVLARHDPGVCTDRLEGLLRSKT